MIISIIVPVYNTSKFLAKCINSILEQSYRDYELLLVDDGSTDNSGKICDQFASEDSRIRVFHKPNGGVDSARNLGIENAKGNYFYFVDSDDTLLPGCLETLISGYQYEDVELVVGGYIYSREGLDDPIPNNLPLTHLLTRNQIMQELLNPKFFNLGMPWTNLYKASIIKENQLLFNKDIYTIDDRLFMVSYICAMKGKVFHTTKPIYIYNLGVGITFIDKSKYDKRNKTIFDGQTLIYKLVKEGNFSKKNQWWARFRMMNSFYMKKKYFLEFNDKKTVDEMAQKLYSTISHMDYFIFVCRKKGAIIIKDLLSLVRK